MHPESQDFSGLIRIHRASKFKRHAQWTSWKCRLKPSLRHYSLEHRNRGDAFRFCLERAILQSWRRHTIALALPRCRATETLPAAHRGSSPTPWFQSLAPALPRGYPSRRPTATAASCRAASQARCRCCSRNCRWCGIRCTAACIVQGDGVSD